MLSGNDEGSHGGILYYGFYEFLVAAQSVFRLLVSGNILDYAAEPAKTASIVRHGKSAYFKEDLAAVLTPAFDLKTGKSLPGGQFRGDRYRVLLLRTEKQKIFYTAAHDLPGLYPEYIGHLPADINIPAVAVRNPDQYTGDLRQPPEIAGVKTTGFLFAIIHFLPASESPPPARNVRQSRATTGKIKSGAYFRIPLEQTEANSSALLRILLFCVL